MRHFRGAWYIIPLQEILGKQHVSLYPNSEKGDYEKYREAWHLLKDKPKGSKKVDRIQACADETLALEFPVFLVEVAEAVSNQQNGSVFLSSFADGRIRPSLHDFFTVCKLLKGLAEIIPPAKFILRFPRSSTGKSQRPQLLHKGLTFLCCEAQQSDGEWVQRNVKLPELAE